MLFGAFAAIYYLKNRLPTPVCREVARLGFYPLLPVTIVSQLTRGGWYNEVMPGVLLGAVPIVTWLNIPYTLYTQHNVRAVVNLMDEYEGPVDEYARLGINHLRIPTVDHQDVDPKKLLAAMRFIRKHRERNEAVYIHCKAGHGRGATTAFAWMIVSGFANGNVDAIQAQIARTRRVRSNIFGRSKTLQLLYDRLLRKDIDDDSDAEEEATDSRSQLNPHSDSKNRQSPFNK